jgi:hypothetical protein
MPQKQNSGAGFRRVSGSVSGHEMTQSSGSVSGPTSPGSISTPTSISRVGASICQRSEAAFEHQPICSQPVGRRIAGEPGGGAIDEVSAPRLASLAHGPTDRPASPSGCHFPGSLTTPVEPSTVRRATPGPADPSASPYWMPLESAMNRDVNSAAQDLTPPLLLARWPASSRR